MVVTQGAFGWRPRLVEALANAYYSSDDVRDASEEYARALALPKASAKRQRAIAKARKFFVRVFEREAGTTQPLWHARSSAAKCVVKEERVTVEVTRGIATTQQVVAAAKA